MIFGITFAVLLAVTFLAIYKVGYHEGVIEGLRQGEEICRKYLEPGHIHASQPKQENK